jgi:hypothetical protein
MYEESKIDPKHAATRTFLRVAGPALVVIGLLFMVVGIADFFMAFNSFDPPRYFWCVFVGIPLLGVGSAMCQYGYMGAWLRYVSAAAAPVGKDTFNYLAGGTRESVKDVAQAVGEGLASANDGARCPNCRQRNDRDSRFCKHCGAAMTA